MRRTTLILTLAAIAAALPGAARASCSVSSRLVTYYSEPDQPASSTDPRCSRVRTPLDAVVCRIQLRGVLYSPIYPFLPGQPLPQLPAIVYNHGSEHTFEAESKACAIAEYFVPRGYHVFVPFRRGHGEIPAACLDAQDHRRSALNCPLGPDESTGTYIGQATDEWKAGGGDSVCGTSTSCHKVKLLQAQTDDVVEGFKWLRLRGDVADDRIAISGSSFGGIMTVLVNATDIGQRAAVAFSPGAASWASDQGDPNTYLQDALLGAAADARKPAYYLQARWDHDTRPTVELARAHAYGGGDDEHGRPFNAGIFNYPFPPIDPDTGEPDWQSVHTGFARDTANWGPSVLAFLERYGVK